MMKGEDNMLEARELLMDLHLSCKKREQFCREAKKKYNPPYKTDDKYEAGSHNICAIAGLNASLKWLNSIGIVNVWEQEKKHTYTALEIILKHKNLRNSILSSSFFISPLH